MVIATYDAIEKIVDDKIANSAGALQSIYDQRLGDPINFPKHQYVPHCIYFFYIRVNGNGAIKVDHYFYFEGPPDDPSKWAPILYDDVDDKIKMLAYNARPLGNGNPSPLPRHNFDTIVLRRKSYVAFFLDEGNWAFHKRLGPTPRTAMVFNKTKAGVDNYSFFDGKDLEFLMDISGTGGQQDLRTGVVLVNHMKDANGDDLTVADSPQFAFDMYFDVTFADPSSKKLTVIFDPGGTNQGPPEQP
jgi:hypothetical protein